MQLKFKHKSELPAGENNILDQSTRSYTELLTVVIDQWYSLSFMSEQ